MNKNLVGIAKKVCEFAGNYTDPIVPVVIIAVFKAILRPAFTLSNKHQPPERKRYAALREFLTELVAIPTYLTVSKLASGPLANALAKKHAISPEMIPKVGKVFSFIAITIAAGAIIPTLCNLVIKPIMNLYDKSQQKHKLKEIKEPKPSLNISLDNNAVPAFPAIRSIQTPTGINQSQASPWANFYRLPGMKVGGL